MEPCQDLKKNSWRSKGAKSYSIFSVLTDKEQEKSVIKPEMLRLIQICTPSNSFWFITVIRRRSSQVCKFLISKFYGKWTILLHRLGADQLFQWAIWFLYASIAQPKVIPESKLFDAMTSLSIARFSGHNCFNIYY
jgi:hypothetical protein